VYSVVALAALGAASAQEFGYRGWGPRVGLSLDPDQAYAGIHLDLGEFARNVRFQPNAEIGLGDDAVLLAINLEAAYLFPVQQSWMPYAGGGVGINYVNYDDPSGPGGDDDDTDFGVSVLGGVQRVRSGAPDIFLELKLGLSDSPDAKFAVGWTFGKPTRSTRGAAKKS
jgi:hypothetical protein